MGRGRRAALVLQACLLPALLATACGRAKHDGTAERTRSRPRFDPETIFPPGLRHVDRGDPRVMAAYGAEQERRSRERMAAMHASPADLADAEAQAAALRTMPAARRDAVLREAQCMYRRNLAHGGTVAMSAIIRHVGSEPAGATPECAGQADRKERSSE